MAISTANRNTDPVLQAEYTERNSTWVTVAPALSGDNTILAAPGAGKRLVVAAVKIQRGVGVTAETLGYWQWGAGAEAPHFWFTKTNDSVPGEVVFLPPGNRWVGPANTVLVLDLSGANAHLVSVQYFAEDI